MKDYRVALLLNKNMANSILNPEIYGFLQSFAEVNPLEELPEEMTPEVMKSLLKDADACMTCWGTPGLTDEMLAAAPKLKMIAHAAGSIKHMVPSSFWTSGRRVTSNAGVIAEDVAHTVLAFMLFAARGLWTQALSTKAGEWAGGEKSLFATKRLEELNIGIIGASLVGKAVIKVLKPFNCILNVYDPLMPKFEADELGVNVMGLEEVIATSDILTLHAPAIEKCRHMINADNLKLLKDGALFINTARGMIVDEAALIKELETGRFFACIDVTDPEPPVVDHPFRKMENVILTPHVAGGATANGRKMLGKNSAMEIYNYLHRGTMRFEVRAEMLPNMA